MKGKDGKVHEVIREVPLDAKTLAIDSNSEIGKEILGEVVKANAGKGSLVFIDVNHLGKANYFSKGTQGGDEYLAAVADSLRKTLRPGDIVYKNGGDELVVVLGANSPKAVKEITQRMMNEVDKNPTIRRMFKDEVLEYTQMYRDVRKAKSIADLPERVQKTIALDQRAAIAKNFEQFKADRLKSIAESLSEQGKYRGSISAGASLIKADESLGSALKRAEEIATQVKSEYKTRYNLLDPNKYKTEVIIDIPRPKGWGPPIALDPL